MIEGTRARTNFIQIAFAGLISGFDFLLWEACCCDFILALKENVSHGDDGL